MKNLCAFTSLALTVVLAQAAWAGTFTVNTTADTHSLGFTSQGAPASTSETDSGGNISLRSALERASTLGGSTTIVLPSGTYDLSLGDLVVGVQANTFITIQGAGTPADTTIHQTQLHQLIFVANYNLNASVVFILQNVTLSGGNEDEQDPDGDGGNGGAILAGGSSSATGNAVTLDNVVFAGNTCGSTTTGTGDGGAISMTGGGNLTVSGCIFSNNIAGVTGNGAGGAIYYDASSNPGNVSVISSSFLTNTATGPSTGLGGAISLAGAANNVFNIVQCTFTGNDAGVRGGAVDLETGLLTANYNRITGNTAPTASGIFFVSGPSGSADVRNNWWGANGGPNTSGSDSCVPTVSSTPPPTAGQISFDPWLQLTHTATPNPVTVANQTTLTASFLANSAGDPIPAGNLSVLIGLPISFNTAVLGTLSGAQPTIQANGTATATFTAGTLTGTGHANAVVDNGTATASVAIQAGPATHFTITAPATATAGTPFSATVTALDSFNNIATGYRGTVHFTSGDTGTGVAVPADYAFVAGDNGAHIFSSGVTLVTGGNQTVTATDTVDSSINGTATVSVLPANASHFVLSAPASANAGSAFNVTVTALDAFNNTATGYRGTVHFTTTDLGAGSALPADYTFVAGDNGVHTFSSGVTLVSAGNQTLTATDTVDSSVNGTATVSVLPANASHFVLNAPASVNAGSAFNVTVTAQDAFNNTATGYRGTVHFTSSDIGTGVAVPADYTFVAGDNGVHTFSSGVTLVSAGNQTVTTTDTVDSSITGTTTVSVLPANASHFVLSAPASASAGSAFNVTVTALDAFNNTATGYRGTVHFTTTDLGAGSALPADYTFVAGDNGVHTFSSGVTLVTVGNQTVTATDTATSSITGTANVSVNPASASHFVLTLPASANSGSAFSVTVTARDPFNNTATGYRGTVHFTSSDALPTLPADYAFTAGDNGAHIFSATLTTPGNQTVTATDTTTSSITGSGSISICPLTIFVDAVNGNDANTGTSPAQAKQTIEAGIATACPGTTVDVSAGTYTPSATLLVDKDLNIVGAGADTTIVSGSANGSGSVFKINSTGANPGPNVLISGLTVRDASTSSGTGNGGGIYNNSFSTLAVVNSIIISNQAGGDFGGAGIYNLGALAVGNSTVSSNQATSVTGSGGGIFTAGTLIVTNSTIAANQALGAGGGIVVSNGTLNVVNSTISGNQAGTDGGGIALASATMTAADATITGNRGTNSSGGLFVTGTVTLDNSIVAGNFSGAAAAAGDIGGGTVNSSSHDLIGDPATAGGLANGVNGNIVGNAGATIDITTVLNSTLANNGGPTLTHALVPTSPAIDAGGQLNEVQEATVTGSSGTFTLSFNGQTTAALAFNATAAQVQAALNGLSTIGGAGGSVTVTASGGVYTITFGGALANSDQSQLAAAGAGGATVAVVTFQDGLAANDQRGPGFQRVFNGTVDIGAFERSPDLSPTGGFTVLGTEGSASSPQTVATFTDRLGPDVVANYAATIDWGDGKPASAGTITLSGNTFTVQGGHTYAEEGTFTISVTMMHGATPSVTTTSTATISDPPVSGTGGFALTGSIGVAMASQTVATFTDPAGAEPVSDYAAVIDWGDGSPASAGAITAASGTFTVTGTHTYALNGTFTIQVTIGHDSASPIIVSSSALITAGTTTTLAMAPNPSAFGQAVTITAAVAPIPPATGTPTGQVTFFDGATMLGTAALDGTAHASITTSALATGSHNLKAVYAGDLNFTASTSSPASQTVNPDATTVVLNSAPNPSVFGQAVNLTATVIPLPPGAGQPGGAVTFFDGATPLGTAPLNAGGQAVFTTTSSLSTGSHSLTAVYAGDPNFSGSTSSPITQTVNPANSATAVVSSANPSFFGQSVSFTATVSPVAPSSGTPTGTVTFSIDGTSAGTVPLDANAHATFATSSLSLGSHSVKAVYSGDASFTTSTSSALSQSVSQASSSTTVVSSANPSVFGQMVTFTVTVSAVKPAAGTPTGTVTFNVDGVGVATATLNSSGVAAYSTSALSSGTRNISVVYGGDTNFGASTVTLAQTVNCVSPVYVDAAGGNDANTGETPAEAKQTIQAAIGASCSGGKVLIKAGTYQPTASLQVDKDLTFTGDGAATTIISGSANGGRSVFTLVGTANSGPTVVLSGLTIRDANVTGTGGGILNNSNCTLTVANSTIVGNHAGSGGGIYNAGTLTLNQSMISSNAASAAKSGGALHNLGTLTVNLSTLNANSASATNSGGALYSSGTATLNESTLSGNSVSSGAGAIWSAPGSSLFVNQSTISGNSATLATGGIAGGGSLALKNTLLSGNTGGDLSGTLSAGSTNNLVGLPAGITSINQILNPTLADNGGPTLTLALVAGSPAVDAGDTNLIPPDALDLNGNGNLTEPVPFDQRGPGHPRVIGTSVDIGAFELPDTVAPAVAISAPSAAITAGGPVTYTVTYSDPDFKTSTLAAANITLNKTGTANGTVSVSGSGNTRTVTLSAITGDGTLGISIAAGTASDTFGNLAAAAGPSATFQVDNTAPSVSISAPSLTTTATGPVTYTVTYSDTNFGSSSLSASNVTLNATETAAGVVAVAGTGAARTVTISNITGHGTLGISLAAGTAVDLAGNLAPTAGPSPTFIVNHPPVAGADTISRVPTQGTTVGVSKLLANDTDADGDVLTITAVQAPSSGKATVSLSGNQVIYTPNAGFSGSDTFTYTVSDTRGGTATGTVTVNVLSSGPTQLAIVLVSSTTVRITVMGSPGVTYTVQSSSALNPANWQTLRTVTTDSQGNFTFDDTISPGSLFYRVSFP